MAEASLGAFLSHSYAATEVNLFFRELISTQVAVTFRVDRGKAATSTTRIERLIRESQVFIGVWSVPAEPGEECDRADLLHASRYFRLELDMARRAKKPGIVFTDHRYGSLLKVPGDMTHIRYDAQEIRLGRASSRWRSLQKSVAAFFYGWETFLNGVPHESDGSVGLLLPHAEGSDTRRVVSELVAGTGRDVVDIRVPLDEMDLSVLGRVDWVISADGEPAHDVARAFLYGQFVPVLRLHQVVAGRSGGWVEDVLFAHLDVGYRKDVVRWSTEDELRAALQERLAVINDEAVLIGNDQEATEYFAQAAKRKSRVFLSYSGEDNELGAEFSAELKKRFQVVFDYRDDESLRAGDFWRDQLNDSLARTAIGVVLFSEKYAASGNCMDEARALYDAKVNGRAALLPVRLDDSKAPKLLSDLHYARLRGRSPSEVIDQFLKNVDPE